MSSRRIRRLAAALVVLGTVALAPPPAQARDAVWRNLGGITRQVRGLLGGFHGALLRLIEPSRGGMDPNGNPNGDG